MTLVNRTDWVHAPVYDVGGVERLCGPDYVAQLWAGKEPTSLRPLFPVAALRNRTGCGYFLGEAVPLDFVGPGERCYAQVRVWNMVDFPTFEDAVSGGAKWGASNIVFAIAGPDPQGGWFGPGGFLVGLESFALVPEPGNGSLLLLGGSWLFWLGNRRKWQAG
jgi:hypothetical protein